MLGELGELGHGGEAGMVGVGGVDAADQGVDQPVVDLEPEAGADQRSDRVRWIGARQERFGGGAQLALPAQQRGRDERPHRCRYAEHDPARDRMQLVVVPHHRLGVGRRREVARLQPDLAGERDRVRHTPQVGIGPFVDVGQATER